MEVGPREERLLERRRALLRAWFNGPYHLGGGAPAQGGGRMVDVERYSDKYARGQREMAPLEEVVLADPKYIPLELFPGRRAAAGGGAVGGAGGRENGEGVLLARMMAGQAGTADREARLEARLEAAVRAEARLGLRQAQQQPPRGAAGLPETPSPNKATVLAGGLEDPLEGEPGDSEEEGDYGDEDYFVGEAFDDDEGYEDDEGFGDEAADGNAYY